MREREREFVVCALPSSVILLCFFFVFVMVLKCVKLKEKLNIRKRKKKSCELFFLFVLYGLQTACA